MESKRFKLACHDSTCPFAVSAKEQPGEQCFAVTQSCLTHTCPRMPSLTNSTATHKVIASFLKANNALPEWEKAEPADIRKAVKRSLGLEISADKASRLKKVLKEAFYGRVEDRYAQLKTYLEEFEKANPGTFTVSVYPFTSLHL